MSDSFEKDGQSQRSTGKSTPQGIPPTTAFYIRQARRIRRAFSSAPTSRFVALRELADAHDRATAVPAAPPGLSPPGLSPAGLSPAGFSHRGKDAAVHVFAQIVEANLCGPLLSYSARKRLLTHAEQLGLSRFDANLIIASVQHHAPGEQGPLTFIAALPDRPRQVAWVRWAGLLAATVAAQIVVVLAIWAMISRP